MTTVKIPSPMVAQTLSDRTVVLGVAGGIAAYKAAELVRLLRKAGATVYVVMTEAAQRFITPLTLQTLSENPVGTELFDLTRESQIGHIDLADRADLIIIAPATADLLARLSLGLADDLLTTVVLASRAQLLLAPAMNVNMWGKPPVQEHMERLRSRGAAVCGPEPGPLACGWVGTGRMSEPASIFAQAEKILTAGTARKLLKKRVVITAGPTFEAIDPVRFIGNRSSGKMGFALASAAAQAGADVTLVAGPVALPTPANVRRIDVESAEQMANAVLPFVAPDVADVIVMSAAVADFRAAAPAQKKLKKSELPARPTLELEPTQDILAELGRRRGDGKQPLLVGFAAETHAVREYALRKLAQKRCDVIIANDVAEAGSGFGTDTNRVTLYFATPKGRSEALPQLPKTEVAQRIWDLLAPLLSAPDSRNPQIEIANEKDRS